MASLIDVLDSLRKLRKLPQGWDYGSGGPVSERAMGSGEQIAQLLDVLGADDFEVVPGSEDGVVVVGYNDEKSAEVHCLSSGQFELLHESDLEQDYYTVCRTIVDLAEVLGELGWQSPRFYASCTRNAIFQESSDTLVWPSRTPLEVVYRSFVPNVSRNQEQSSATISDGFTTKTPAVNRQSSGEFLSIPFREALA
jgi:hypothetical protein